MRMRFERPVSAPAAAVFAAASDFADSARRISAIDRVEMITGGPVGVGTRFRETRTMFGRQATEEMEVVEFEAGRRYVLGAASCGCRYRTEVRVVPDGGHSRVVMEFRAEPTTWLARGMAFLMRPMIKSVAKACARDLDDLRAAVEAGRAAP